MGTTRVKVIDLSSDKKEIKTSGKHAHLAKRAEKIAPSRKTKDESKKPVGEKVQDVDQNILQTPQKQADIPKTETAPLNKQAETKAKVKETNKTLSKSNRHMGANYLKAQARIENGKIYPAQEAIELLINTSYVKFDPTVELHLTVTDKNVKGSVNLPHAAKASKEKTYLIFSDKKEDIENKKIIWANDAAIGQIESGSIKPKRDFDVVLATAKYMPRLARVAKILGPAGMMPNPKNGTVVEDVKESLNKEKAGGYEYRTEPNAPVIHTTLGKLSLKSEKISENAKVLISAIGPAKIISATITSTMGPGIKVDPVSFIGKITP